MTPTYVSTLNPDGSPQTNLVILTPYPPGSPFYINGTNIIFGATTVVLAPNAQGFVSNSLEPITYAVTYSNAPQVGFFATILDTTNYLPITSYATALPVVQAGYGTGFGFITNQLGYWPSTNTFAGIKAALGFQPATNTYAALSNALGFLLVTNSPTGVEYALGFTPPTNSYPALTNVLGFVPATNADPRIGLAITNLTGDMYTATQVGGTASTTLSNTVLAGTAAKVTFDSKGRVTSTNQLLLSDLPALGKIGATNAPNTFMVTNGWTIYISLATNGPPGPAWTNIVGGPYYAVLTTTNHALPPYWLSNSAGLGVWMSP